MTYDIQIKRRAAGAGQIVRAPQRTDAIGDSLRSVYGHPADLPAELHELLVRIDLVSPRLH